MKNLIVEARKNEIGRQENFFFLKEFGESRPRLGIRTIEADSIDTGTSLRAVSTPVPTLAGTDIGSGTSTMGHITTRAVRVCSIEQRRECNEL